MRPFYEKHGMKYTPTYSSWRNMKERCKGRGNSTTRQCYIDKGITYCEKWEKFSGFYEDMGVKPKGHWLDRIDSDKGYYKENCRWVNPSLSGANTKRKKRVLPRGVKKHHNRYVARIGVSDDNYIGTFATVEEAERACIERYKKLYGELPPEYR